MSKKVIEIDADKVMPPAEASEFLKSGYIKDYVSDIVVKASPEEIDAVQVFSRKLVEDYGYPKTYLQTRPQFRVRIRPSDEAKGYPIDIAVFNGKTKTEDDLFMVVECKKKNKKDGLAQLKLYLDMSPASLGVWFNGNEHVYLQKLHRKSGAREYRELPNIPRYGQRIEDIGLYKRKDLVTPSNLKAVFRDLRNHLAGTTTGITRDEALAQEIINLLFCKILDEQGTSPEETVTFRAGVDEEAKEVKKRILDLFEKVKTAVYDDVFLKTDTITLDAESVRYVVGELQNYCVMDADRDAIGDAFEVFIGPALRGTEGQFFTPRNVVKMMVDILDPKPGEKIIDPACGSGGFLITALAHVWEHIQKEAKQKKWTERQRIKQEVEVATNCFRGIDKDSFLAKVCKAYMALIGDGRGGVFCENSLLPPTEWNPVTQSKVEMGTFDVLLTNPPFGAKIPIKGSAILSQYDLGYKWGRDKATKEPIRLAQLEEKRSPQILFLERCLQLLKPGGRMGIVLPESIIGNPSYEYLVAFMQKHTLIRGVVTMPEQLFKTSGKGGTHTKVAVLFLEKRAGKKDYEIFMSDVKWCGHDSRGNPTLRKNPETGKMVLLDEVPLVPKRYREVVRGARKHDHLGFLLKEKQINNRIFVPKYYDPEIESEINGLKKTHKLMRLGDLQKSKVISVDTGVEIGKMAYGTGTIPFIRTSDLSNWEIKADFKHGVSKKIYDDTIHKIDVKNGDILLVRDGTYLIGTSAIVTEADLPMLFQSHIYRVRVLKPSVVSPWLLFACLNTPIVKRQIRSKQFTQDIIDTLGKRFMEILIPVPKDEEFATKIGLETQSIIEDRAKLRNRAKEIALELQGPSILTPEDMEVLSDI
ncbi:N-6 DNA methylase [Leptospirillum ferriphilum]|uniref:N-6 DNA methylase n=1 Tax=Leptospirillum ferriphilum TaxID=178606 RepID=UPI0006B2230E|nr:N-6 DNA methylase [Leptospirillum ferriphilum]